MFSMLEDSYNFVLKLNLNLCLQIKSCFNNKQSNTVLLFNEIKEVSGQESRFLSFECMLFVCKKRPSNASKTEKSKYHVLYY